MAMNKRKTTTAIVAGVTAAALLLGGTFAWTSISQQARNEAIVDINPGGRLHDDFNGTNKDVYVENFSSGATGVNIFARIRLDQYFEVGQDAGINKEVTDRKVNQILGTDINDESTWITYTPGTDLGDTSQVQANDNWQWNLGREMDEDGDGNSDLPYYMPTFNKNKDSLKADINGTYEGTKAGDIVHYDDYAVYVDAEGNLKTITADATYDWDEDTEDEKNPTSISDRNLPIDSADVLIESEDHTATQITTGAYVISMQDWLALPAEEQIGNFWVYDTDGWAYWANYIAPGETTGLLLDSINMSRVPDDNYYYGINVVGQFATASDWEMLYTPAENGGGGSMTEEAKSLMELITATAPSEGGGEDDNTDDEGTLTLRADNADTVWTTHGVQIPVEFVTDDLDPDADGYVAPDISEIKVYIEGAAEDGSDDTILEKDAQYTYTYDEATQTGTLTITDTALEDYIHVTDKNGVVEGDVSITAETALELTAEGSNSVEINPGDSIRVFSNDTTADMSAIKVSYWTDFTEDGTPIYTDLTEDQYRYDAETGELNIYDYEISDDYRITDNNGNVSGYLSIYYETDATTLSISYAANGEYSEIVQRGYIMPGESLMLVASASNGQHINSEDCTWTASCGEGHPCTFDTTTGELVISDLDNDVTPHLIIVTCTYVIPETGEELYDEFHIMISDEDLIFATTATGTGATGEALTLSTTVSTATDGVIELGELEWEYTITDENGGWVGESDVAAVNGDQFMAFKQGTYYVTASYGEDFLYAKTPSAIEVTSGEEMNRYYAQIETGYDDETDTPIYGNVTVGTTDADLYVIDRSIGESYGGFNKYESTTEGITVTYDEGSGNWLITVAETVDPGEYTLNYTIYGDQDYNIPDTTGTVELVIDAAA